MPLMSVVDGLELASADSIICLNGLRVYLYVFGAIKGLFMSLILVQSTDIKWIIDYFYVLLKGWDKEPTHFTHQIGVMTMPLMSVVDGLALASADSINLHRWGRNLFICFWSY